jgi:uncharacterized phage protein (TIGR01671 family)
MENRYLSRGKRIDNGEWVKGNLIRSNDAEVGYEAIIIPTNDSNMYTRGGDRGDLGFENWHKVDKDTICRCTGREDKNGKLIFENDILSGHIDVEFPEDETRKRVVWHENGWCANEPGYDDYEALDDFDSENFEVIGNMIENPELLEA